MGRIYYITGGAYSGKSALAENISNQFERLGIIVMGKNAEEKAEEIEAEVVQKTGNWECIHLKGQLDRVLIDNDHDLFVLDSLSALVKQRLRENFSNETTLNHDVMRKISEAVSREVMNAVVAAKENDRNFLVISSEIGMGVVPEREATRFFRAEMGRTNQLMASLADEAYLLVSGIPIKIKG